MTIRQTQLRTLDTKTTTTYNDHDKQLESQFFNQIDADNSNKEKESHNNAIKNTINKYGESWKNATVPNSRKTFKAGVVKTKSDLKVEQREIDDALELGLKTMQELVEIKEPLWYRMGLFLDANDPAHHVANFGKPQSKKVEEITKFGIAALEASKKIAEMYPDNASREAATKSFESRLLLEDCPLGGTPRCPPFTEKYRTLDGTCNNPGHPWRGSAMLPFQRFLPPTYEDGIQEVRRSVLGPKLPSARDVSTHIHQDKDREVPSVTLLFTQWGQFIDHDLTSTVKSRSFNGSVPRCCGKQGEGLLPPEFLHPSCLPIEVSRSDWLLGRFGQTCIEFIRSAPSTRINCDLGWREQLNQVTSYLDASMIYGSDRETSDSIRTFRNGKLQYGRPQTGAPLQPPDPPGGELCRSGALTAECFTAGDGRFNVQHGLLGMHTVFLRYHNRLATVLGKLNKHWGDEMIFHETRKIIGAIIQHITYREFLPIVVGQEVMQLFELNLQRDGYYKGYDERVDPTVANSFSTAAFRFGHSMVQNSYVRFDSKHRPLFNNVTLHQEDDNFENIWSQGSVDRLFLGFMNQPSQRRDEFICNELTSNLFRTPGAPFGMDLAAINIQRGRDHGLPAYTSWREPCGLSPIRTWSDLNRVIHPETVQRFKHLYAHVDDLDLFTAGLAEKPVRGGIVGPTFSCIIAQQFLNLRKGDRFWYENAGFRSTFTPAQLREIKQMTLSQILCDTMPEVKTVQPFVFLSHDNTRNVRLSCNDPLIRNFDLGAWEDSIDTKLDFSNDVDEETASSRQNINFTDSKIDDIDQNTDSTTKFMDKGKDQDKTDHNDLEANKSGLNMDHTVYDSKMYAPDFKIYLPDSSDIKADQIDNTTKLTSQNDNTLPISADQDISTNILNPDRDSDSHSDLTNLTTDLKRHIILLKTDYIKVTDLDNDQMNQSATPKNKTDNPDLKLTKKPSNITDPPNKTDKFDLMTKTTEIITEKSRDTKKDKIGDLEIKLTDSGTDQTDNATEISENHADHKSDLTKYIIDPLKNTLTNIFDQRFASDYKTDPLLDKNDLKLDQTNKTKTTDLTLNKTQPDLTIYLKNDSKTNLNKTDKKTDLKLTDDDITRTVRQKRTIEYFARKSKRTTTRKPKIVTTTKKPPLKIPIKSVTIKTRPIVQQHTVNIAQSNRPNSISPVIYVNDDTQTDSSQKPFEVNIKIQYYQPTTTTTKKPLKIITRKPDVDSYMIQTVNTYPYTPQTYGNYDQQSINTNGYMDAYFDKYYSNVNSGNTVNRPQNGYSDPVTQKPQNNFYFRPNSYVFSPTKRPLTNTYNNFDPDEFFDPIYDEISPNEYVKKPTRLTTKQPNKYQINGANNYYDRDTYLDDMYNSMLNQNYDGYSDVKLTRKPTFGAPLTRPLINDKLDLYKKSGADKFVKISSVKGTTYSDVNDKKINIYTVQRRENDINENKNGRHDFDKQDFDQTADFFDIL